MFTYWIANRNGGLLSSAKGTTTILVRAILFLLITSGLSIHNGLAAVQGLLGRVTPFMRTPKLNIIATGQKITGRRTYLPVFLYPLLAAELSLAVLFSGLAIYCSCPSLYAVVPGFAFFAAGYLMVGYFTVLEMLEAFRLKGAM